MWERKGSNLVHMPLLHMCSLNYTYPFPGLFIESSPAIHIKVLMQRTSIVRLQSQKCVTAQPSSPLTRVAAYEHIMPAHRHLAFETCVIPCVGDPKEGLS